LHLLVQEFLITSVHFYVPIFVDRETPKNCCCFTDRRGTNSLTVAEQILGSLIGGANPEALATNSKDKASISTELRRAEISVIRLAQTWGLPQSHNLMSIGASHNDRAAVQRHLSCRNRSARWRNSFSWASKQIDEIDT